eukprot:gene1473-8810_t
MSHPWAWGDARPVALPHVASPHFGVDAPLGGGADSSAQWCASPDMNATEAGGHVLVNVTELGEESVHHVTIVIAALFAVYGLSWGPASVRDRHIDHQRRTRDKADV